MMDKSGNEPSYHIPYLYNYLVAPWKTQKCIRMLMDTWYRDDLFSIPGDEDGGGTSAFIVLSMLGFYPVTPSIPAYNIGSSSFNPLFNYLMVMPLLLLHGIILKQIATYKVQVLTKQGRRREISLKL